MSAMMVRGHSCPCPMLIPFITTSTTPSRPRTPPSSSVESGEHGTCALVCKSRGGVAVASLCDVSRRQPCSRACALVG